MIINIIVTILDSMSIVSWKLFCYYRKKHWRRLIRRHGKQEDSMLVQSIFLPVQLSYEEACKLPKLVSSFSRQDTVNLTEGEWTGDCGLIPPMAHFMDPQ